MNIFSQSKLTLKLKKPTDTSPTDQTNICQKAEISESLEANELINNSLVSENNSFLEVLHTVQPQEETISMSQNIFKECSTDCNTSNSLNITKRCPICSQMFVLKNMMAHLKSCAPSYKLSANSLLKLMHILEQDDGLPQSTKNKDVKKKKTTNNKTKLKMGYDSNLDLAIAMSVSLQESKEAEIIKESESLLEAGLEKEAIEKRKTLESFGFLTNQPVKSKLKVTRANSLLLKQTKEDREKRITEKVALILIDSDTDALPQELKFINHCSSTKLGSKYLNKIRNIENELWKKSFLEEKNSSEFYVKNLAKFIKPCTSDQFTSLNNISQLSLHKNNFEGPSINDIEISNTSNTVLADSRVGNMFTSILKPSNNFTKRTLSIHSCKWKSMLGNPFMSDITIFTKDELKIPAHSLVLHVQCPDILNDVITEESNDCKLKKIIMWLEYSYEACISLLELIYCGRETFIRSAAKEDYLKLATRYNILVSMYDDQENGIDSEEILMKRKSSEIYESPTDNKKSKASSPDMFQSDDMNIHLNTYTSSPNFLGATVSDENTLSVLKTKQWLNSCRKNHISSFTEIADTNIPPNTISLEKSPSHSFHSASTINVHSSLSNNECANLTEFENNIVNNSSSESISNSSRSLLTDHSSLKIVWSNSNKLCNVSIKNSNNLCKEPEIITIDNDSESESVDMIWSNNVNRINKLYNENTFSKINHFSENNIKSFSQSRSGKKNVSFTTNVSKCENDINTIELNNKPGMDYDWEPVNIVRRNSSPIVPKLSYSSNHSIITDSSSKYNKELNTPKSSILSNEMDVLNKSNSSLKLLSNALINKSSVLPSKNHNYSFINTKEVIDLTSSPTSEYRNHMLIEPVSNQMELVQPSEINISNDNEMKNEPNFEQIIDDPWMDYNDWEPIDINYHNSSFVDQKLTLSTTIVTSNHSNQINSNKKNIMTPNKYGSRISTPKSFRRIQSESFIGSKEQVTPLPDYSAMKTPDLRNEFDRYGLKDLGKRKGKLILRHIYDTLHPLIIPKKADLQKHNEKLSNSSDSSEGGIPDYEYESYDELETLSQTNSTNKIPIEMGFIQLLKANKDLHSKILCYQPIWIEELKENLKKYNVSISMQKLMTFLDDKCVTYRSKSLNDQRQKTQAKRNTKRKKLF